MKRAFYIGMASLAILSGPDPVAAIDLTGETQSAGTQSTAVTEDTALAQKRAPSNKKNNADSGPRNINLLKLAGWRFKYLLNLTEAQGNIAGKLVPEAYNETERSVGALSPIIDSLSTAIDQARSSLDAKEDDKNEEKEKDKEPSEKSEKKKAKKQEKKEARD